MGLCSDTRSPACCGMQKQPVRPRAAAAPWLKHQVQMALSIPVQRPLVSSEEPAGPEGQARTNDITDSDAPWHQSLTQRRPRAPRQHHSGCAMCVRVCGLFMLTHT